MLPTFKELREEFNANKPNCCLCGEPVRIEQCVELDPGNSKYDIMRLIHAKYKPSNNEVHRKCYNKMVIELRRQSITKFVQVENFYDGDEFHHNLLIPKVTPNPHLVSQVCVNCGLSRVSHHPSNRSIEDWLGRSSSIESGCKKFKWDAGYRCQIGDKKDKLICEYYKHVQALKAKTLYKCLTYAIFTHDPCTVCKENESFILVWKCGDLESNFYDAVTRHRAGRDLGKFSHYEDATETDVFDLTSIVRYNAVINNPASNKHLNYCYRKFLKNKFKKQNKILRDALKMTKRDFEKKYVTMQERKIFKLAKINGKKITPELISQLNKKENKPVITIDDWF